MKRISEPVEGDNKHQKLDKQRLPVSILCGFLGAGKTTLLKHILETKHSEKGIFRCAVIVNDVAELNIDKSLIDDSAFVQSDDVIAMQNGCVCCTIRSDLLNQITDLARRKVFDYMIIEASGVSEPSQIAKVFADCSEDHNHETEHKEETLGELARLDTCVTVVDSANFFSHLEKIIQGPEHQSFAQLLIEQVEYANVVVLNKTDLIEKAQLDKISEQKINVIENLENSGNHVDRNAETVQGDGEKGEQRSESDAAAKHSETSHIDKGADEQQAKSDPADGSGKMSQGDVDREEWNWWQQESAKTQALRTEKMGTLFRSKGFIWLANLHDFKGVFNQAGNLVKVEGGGLWTVMDGESWSGTEENKAKLRKDWMEPWGDRRQDLVFIGKDLKHEAIQKLLDECLLSDKELAMGLDGWKATIGDFALGACIQNGLWWT